MPDHSHQRPGRVLGWAVYLGVSWTWCIGMYLPVLLLRDLGLAGFWVFAIPNVIGAAAMGWVLRDAEQSRQMTRRHASACIWFSLVTILFHVFFAAWIIRRIVGPGAGLWLAGIFFVFWLIIRRGAGSAMIAALIALAVSVAAMTWGFVHPGLLPRVAHPIAGAATTGMPLDAVWLAPVCLLGFGLCPYLDLTFHNARQALSPGASRAAFGIGFGVVFAAMLAFTFSYSGWLAEGFHRRAQEAIVLILGSHFIAQACFTVAAHVQQLGKQASKLRVRQFLIFAIAFVVVVVIGTLDHRDNFVYRGMSLGESGYRCFMVFYGLVFPAYVWLRIVPGHNARAGNLRLAITLIIAAPMYWMGFIERQMIWLTVGAIVVLLGAISLPSGSRKRSESPA